MADEKVQSDEVRRNWADVLDKVQHGDDQHIWVMRYTKVAAVMVPWEWYTQASAHMAAAAGREIIAKYAPDEGAGEKP
jgi:antitoxin (DNA-binding transcriptional repressor) of toxin-antitoxin stability system